MKSKHSIHSAASCGLLLALLAVIPAQAFADGTPLSNLYKTDSSTGNSSARYPRPRYENGVQAYVWGDMQLDVRPGDKIICKANVADKQATCFYTPSKGVDFSNLDTSTDVYQIDPSKPNDYNPTTSPKQPDSVKVGFKINGKTLNKEFEQLDVDKNPVDIAVEGKPGRLWAYVWDFNTSLGKVAQVKEKDYLKTSFFARLPNGHPVEIKLDNVSGDAFSVAGYRDVTNEYTKSPEWDYRWKVFGLSKRELQALAADLAIHKLSTAAANTMNRNSLVDWIRSNTFGQGDCDADNWGKYNSELYKPVSSFLGGAHFKFYYSGALEANEKLHALLNYTADPKAYDNSARRCVTRITEAKDSNGGGLGYVNLSQVPLYLETPEFARLTEIRLGNVKVIPNADGASDACVFPVFDLHTTSKQVLRIEGLGSKAGLGQLVCQKVDKSLDRLVRIFTINAEGTGEISPFNPDEGKYNCYVERVEQFDMSFVDAEQVGSMRMYEVMPTGERIPLLLNWDDKQLSKTSVYYTPTQTLTPANIFRLSGGGEYSSMDSRLSAYSDEATPVCSGSGVNARCWGDYASTDSPDNKKYGVGNADVINTWTYYPVSDRFSFTLIAVDATLYPIQKEYLTNECVSAPMNVDPTSHKSVPSTEPIDNDTDSNGKKAPDGIPDVVEGRPGVKISSDGKKEVPGTDTDGDGKPNHNDKDSDGDGIPDHVECHFNPSHTGYGFVNGCEDTDHDGIPDYKDTDSDNDGVPDKIECVFALGEGTFIEGCIVSDPANKYVPDYRNPDVKGGKPGTKDTDDADGDGIPDKVEVGPDPTHPVDTDGDGIPDYQDTDSDNDGIPDSVENKGADPNKKGQKGYDKDGNIDTDGDGKPDYQDPDSDGDLVPDKVECIYSVNNIGVEYIDGCISSNGNNLPDYRDGNTKSKDGEDTDSSKKGIPDKIEKDLNGDDDHDGIPNKIECPGYGNKKDPHVGPHVNGCPDTDGDGVPDYQDPDSDNDGIPDNVENQEDNNHKKKLDVDNDGNPDVVDSDGDGIPDYKDTDSDNDGIPDKVEAGPNPKKPVDTDSSSSNPAERDGIPDYRDKDSDGDGLPDKDECHYDSSNKSSKPIKPDDKYVDGCVATPGTNKTASPRLPDYRDPKTKIDGSGSAGKGKGDDTDGDGIPDSAEGRDYHNDGNSRKTLPGASKPDYDNTDTDGDGVPDKVECPDWNPLHVGKNYADGCPDTDGNGVPDYRQPDSNNDGKKDGDQCNYDPSTGKCKIDPFGKDGYRHNDGNKTKFAQPGEGSNNTGSGTDNAFGGIIAGGCGCAEAGGSAPLSSGLFSLLLTALGIFGIRRRRRNDT